MPFGGWYDHYYKMVFKPAIAEAGLIPKRSDDLSRSSTIINDIWNFTKDAAIVLADLTEENPNVFYELGLAHALGKPVVLIASSIEEVPFDLRSLRVLIYDRNDPHWGDSLKKAIVKSIEEILIAPTKSILPIFLAVEDTVPRPTVSKQDQEFLQLRNDFEALRRQIEAQQSYLPHFKHTVAVPFWNKTRENRLFPSIKKQICAGLRKGASEASIIKRILSLGVPEEVAWEILRKEQQKISLVDDEQS